MPIVLLLLALRHLRKMSESMSGRDVTSYLPLSPDGQLGNLVVEMDSVLKN
jgi:hypothetical protein